MGKYKNPFFMHKTNSLSGFVETDIEIRYPTAFYYYVRRRTANGVDYYGRDCEWTDFDHAVAFSRKNAIKIRSALRKQYIVDIFRTTKRPNKL